MGTEKSWTMEFGHLLSQTLEGVVSLPDPQLMSDALWNDPSPHSRQLPDTELCVD